MEGAEARVVRGSTSNVGRHHGANGGGDRGTANPPFSSPRTILSGGDRRLPRDSPDRADGDPEVRRNPPRPLPGLQHRLDGVSIEDPEQPPRAPPV
jgi:hypothetical protein